MKRTGVGICLVSLACSAAPGAARGATSRAPEQKARPRIVIEDVDRFYKIYDAESGHPTADQLQHEYLDQGSEGLHRFAKMRKISGTAIAESLVRQPELISGEVSNSKLATSTGGREKEIETAFLADVDKTDLSNWLYNSTFEKPGDLGYWVGYRVVKCYYQHTADKRDALREILEMADPQAFLAKSGWYPGIHL